MTHQCRAILQGEVVKRFWFFITLTLLVIYSSHHFPKIADAQGASGRPYAGKWCPSSTFDDIRTRLPQVIGNPIDDVTEAGHGEEGTCFQPTLSSNGKGGLLYRTSSFDESFTDGTRVWILRSDEVYTRSIDAPRFSWEWPYPLAEFLFVNGTHRGGIASAGIRTIPGNTYWLEQVSTLVIVEEIGSGWTRRYTDYAANPNPRNLGRKRADQYGVISWVWTVEPDREEGLGTLSLHCGNETSDTVIGIS